MKLFITFFLFVALGVANVSAACEGAVGMDVGNCAPEFVLTKKDGNRVRLGEFLGKKVVFLHFWATWCPPCEEEMPSMEALHKSVSAKNFQMFVVSIDEDGWTSVDPFIKKMFMGEEPSFSVFVDPKKKVASKYGTFKVPETFVIDKTGRIVDKIQGTKEWQDPMIHHYLELLGRQ